MTRATGKRKYTTFSRCERRGVETEVGGTAPPAANERNGEDRRQSANDSGTRRNRRWRHLFLPRATTLDASRRRGIANGWGGGAAIAPSTPNDNGGREGLRLLSNRNFVKWQMDTLSIMHLQQRPPGTYSYILYLDVHCK